MQKCAAQPFLSRHDGNWNIHTLNQTGLQVIKPQNQGYQADRIFVRENMRENVNIFDVMGWRQEGLLYLKQQLKISSTGHVGLNIPTSAD